MFTKFTLFTWFILLFTLFSLFGSVSADTNYTVVGPTSLRPGHPYSFSVQIYGVPNPVSYTLLAKIVNSGDDNDVLVEEEFTVVHASLQTFSLNVPINFPDTAYTFKVTASGGKISFNNSHYLSVSQKTHSVFIQTDKYLYKPGQTIKFRVLGIQSNLKPYKEAFNITIYVRPLHYCNLKYLI
ncbi:hypothetical protein HELRODRAFT_175322 [Helobdella robusta]|uniref:Macroglobulin domain-containing protein n=1 Tax=Helobdella robusta TaxID=6412 RepID=T1F950_HELRO|nr:hypothetical protein HELRODRAFT_175322 [Helobdella robusta]ESO00831.1 hypothetical protein HELRODRAFT_175322 [Helobdella robusta]